MTSLHNGVHGLDHESSCDKCVQKDATIHDLRSCHLLVVQKLLGGQGLAGVCWGADDVITPALWFASFGQALDQDAVMMATQAMPSLLADMAAAQKYAAISMLVEGCTPGDALRSLCALAALLHSAFPTLVGVALRA